MHEDAPVFDLAELLVLLVHIDRACGGGTGGDARGGAAAQRDPGEARYPEREPKRGARLAG